MGKSKKLVLAALLGSGCAADDYDKIQQTADQFDDPMKWVAVDANVMHLIDHVDHGLNLQPAEVVGDVLLVPISPDEIGKLSGLIHEEGHRCGGFTAHTSLDNARESASLAAVPRATSAAAVIDFTIDNGQAANAMIAATQESNIRSTITSLASFHNRKHDTSTGKEASIWLRDFWQELVSSRNDASVTLISHTSSPQESVMMTITGTTNPSEVVIVGGHLDSINITGGSDLRAPGADDNASGIASLSEVARAMVATDFRPERTVHFIGYAAEEVGLRGSAEIAKSFANNGTNVVAVMQLDMTNFSDPNATDIVLIRDFTDDGLSEFTGNLASTYLPQLTVSNSTCGYACSDHASWTRNGYPSVFPFETPFDQSNPRIHTDGDTLAFSGSDAVHAHKFTKLAAAFVAEVAKGTAGGDNPEPNDDGGGDDGGGDDGGGDDGGEGPCQKANACGTQNAAPEGCFCDPICVEYGDCCSDGPC